MYNVAHVENSKCTAEKGCRLCIMYCPEADTILLNPETQKAEIVIQRCKGCELCVIVCTTAKAITMHPVDGATGNILLGHKQGEVAGLGQAYAG
ncbi:MAG: pyruvate ferredoxin oxidoreductase [Nitrospinae bacterium CG11_big_fil_rev_8_21_14_0_20_56_8]|nr:MAG: pyruvate ferredoxin oxidoreductase [Nitrospinae bacterium CG11_big_fil_rev_8_21_14_0_20_56_8]